MGLFDLFKNNSKKTSQEDLTLEELLQKASTQTSFRTEFYKRLLTDDLIVITKDSELPHGDNVLEKDTQVKIVSFPDGKIPVFTSIERIFDKGIIKEKVVNLKMKGKDIFELAKDATFILNPYSDYGKELLPNEIRNLLNGTIMTATHEEIIIRKETQVQIGQPANYPTEIVNALRQLFSDNSKIKAAYLGWIYNPSTKEPPHFIFGLDSDGDIQNEIKEAGLIVRQFIKPDEFVDFIRIDDKSELSDYFVKQTKPFYKK